MGRIELSSLEGIGGRDIVIISLFPVAQLMSLDPGAIGTLISICGNAALVLWQVIGCGHEVQVFKNAFFKDFGRAGQLLGIHEGLVGGNNYCEATAAEV